MPDVSFDAEQVQSQSVHHKDSDCDAVCIDAARIYDSCGAKDCLRDLPVMFTSEDQEIVENACSCKVCKVSVITSTVNVEPVAFHRGFYSVDMVFYFAVTCEVYTTAASLPTTITGLTTYAKRVVLYGSDGCVKTFSSEESGLNCSSPGEECSCCHKESVPKATVQISDPMALSAKLKCHRSHEYQNRCNHNCNTIPACVTAFFGEPLVNPRNNFIAVTIGIFTITQLIRNVQLLIPSYDYCIPRKECTSRTDDPCEAFSKIEFPTDCFFPPNSDDDSGNQGPHFGKCDCE
ncbi:MAG: hypothetical protein J1E85_03820 [Ruminococcus sp.]|nr:hypothetical protein [Ruminococcus sp.]